MVGNVAAILNVLQSGEAISTLEPLEWLRAERWHTPFPVATTVHRENLRSILSDGEITNLSDEDMIQIAAKMADAYQYSDIWWQSLEAAVKTVLEEKSEESLASNTASSQTEDPTP